MNIDLSPSKTYFNLILKVIEASLVPHQFIIVAIKQNFGWNRSEANTPATTHYA